MQSKTLFTVLTLAALALAGCSESPPSGTVSFDRSAIDINGEATWTFMPFENGYRFGVLPESDPTGTAEASVLCALDVATTPVNDGIEGGGGPRLLPECNDSRTEVRIELHEYPEPSATGFTAFAMLTDGTERALGALALNDDNMYVLEGIGFDGEDLTGLINNTEVRMGDLVLFTAGGAAGSNAFEVASVASGASLSGTWEGKDLTLTVSGLPTGAFTGWLIGPDENGDAAHLVEFSITGNGVVTFTAPMDLGMYDEVHIHASGSKVNYGIASIN